MIKELIFTKTEEYDTYSSDIDLDLFIEYGKSNISLLLNTDHDDGINIPMIINQMIQNLINRKVILYYIYLFTKFAIL